MYRLLEPKNMCCRRIFVQIIIVFIMICLLGNNDEICENNEPNMENCRICDHSCSIERFRTNVLFDGQDIQYVSKNLRCNLKNVSDTENHGKPVFIPQNLTMTDDKGRTKSLNEMLPIFKNGALVHRQEYPLHDNKENLPSLICYSASHILKFTFFTCLVLSIVLNFNLEFTIAFKKSSICFGLNSESKKGHSYDFIFQFWNQPASEVKVNPLSLKNYLNEIEKVGDKNVERMNYEWARYESFQTFPEDCPVSIMRLAQSGFYYTGKGQEAVCFCCGLKNGEWTTEESVTEVHTRLSPNCKFIRGEKTENVPIHSTEETEQNQSGGACGGPGDMSENIQQTENQNDQTRNEDQRPQQVTHETQQNLVQPNTSTARNSHNASDHKNQPGYIGRYSEYRPTGDIQHFPGITDQQAKHPDYAIKSVRLSSFSQWASTNVLSPSELAEAGFFSCGMLDMVRCFFCGGGIKSWEDGDSPWIEHARWFPTCAYLIQCKGQDFVNLCQISNMTFPTQSNFDLRNIDSQQANTVDDQHITDLNSVAAKRIFDMGYTQAQVEEAIRHTRTRIGFTEEIKAQYLLEYLLDNTYTRANASELTTSRTQGPHTNDNRTRSSSPNSSQPECSNGSSNRSSPEHQTKNSSSNNTHKTAKNEGKSLKEENRHLKEQIMCKICMDKDANIVFLPCGHLVSCVECAHALRKCAVCRTVIQGTVRAYPA